jgi:hypothetical protein
MQKARENGYLRGFLMLLGDKRWRKTDSMAAAARTFARMLVAKEPRQEFIWTWKKDEVLKRERYEPLKDLQEIEETGAQDAFWMHAFAKKDPYSDIYTEKDEVTDWDITWG